MFCSHCGKSLRPEDEKCPHCGAIVGESRFEGNPPYTSAQEKLRPGKAVRAYGTVYSEENVVETENPGEELPSDSDSDYRASKQPERQLYDSETDTYGDEQPEEEQAEEEKPARKPFGLNFLHKNETEDADEAAQSDEPDNDEDDEKVGPDGLTDKERKAISITEDDAFEPIKPKGIDPDVSSYMQRLKDNEERKKAGKGKKQAASDDQSEDQYADSVMKEARKTRAAKPKKPAKKEEPEEPDDVLEPDDAEPEYGDDEPEEAPKEKKKKSFAPLKNLHISMPSLKKKKKSDEDDLDGDELTEDTEDIEDTNAAAEPADSDEVKDTAEGDEFDEFGDFEDESKPKKKLKLSFPKIKLPSRKSKKKDEDELADEEPADDEANDEEEVSEEDAEFTEADYELDQQRRNRFRLIKNIAVIVLALAIIVGAVIGVTTVREKSKTAPIETVTLSLWNDGIDLIQSRVQDSYRKKMLALYDKSDPTTYLTLQAAFTEDLDSLSNLMPESPLTSDQVFINALKAIQESINNCLSNDALSMTDTVKTTAEKDQESALRWESVQEIVTTLKNSTNVGQLEAIIKGERVELIQSATATPEPTATPAPYSTLAKGASGLAVSNLQTRLTELGYMSSSIDGDYGNKTKTAVEKFQQAAGLEVTGIADVATQELLYSDDAPSAK